MNAPLPAAALDRAARQREIVAALAPVVPAHALLWQPEDTVPYECDGLTAYRQQPLVVVLPETEAAEAAAAAAPADGVDAAAVRASSAPASPVMRGAVYISCNGRGGPHFGAPSAELKIVQRALGDVPLVGFFAAGEIAHRHLYGYTGVLTVFKG